MSLLLKKFAIFAASTIAPTVSALADGDTNALTTGAVTVGVSFDTDGEEYEYTGVGTNKTSSIGTWLDSGTSSQVWVVYTRTGGTQTAWDNRSNGTRYQISSNIDFRILDSNQNSTAESITGTFSFYDAATGGNLLQTTSSATYSANYLVDMCPLCCFTPWTLITMIDGSTMPIVDIKVGDLIRVEGGVEAVTEIIARDNRPMYLITFADFRVLEASEDHPLFVAGKGYASINPDPTIDYKDLGVAETLVVGDKVLDELGNLNEIVSMVQIDYPDTVYTLGNSKFYANGMLVY